MDILTVTGLTIYGLVMHLTISIMMAEYLFDHQRKGNMRGLTLTLRQYLWVCLTGGWVVVLHFGAYGALQTLCDWVVRALRWER